MVITKYISKVGKNYKVSEHFTLGEFKSPDSDKVLYSTYVLKWLEKIRSHFGGAINITSGYRSPKYNALVNGATNSAHLYGRACDFVVHDANGDVVPSKRVCLWLESVGYKYAIGYILNSTHIDSKYNNRMIEYPRPYIYLNRLNPPKTFKEYFAPAKHPYMGVYPRETVSRTQGSETNIKLWQQYLKWYGFTITVDGKFGSATEVLTKKFQLQNGLTADGSVGSLTIAKAKTIKR